MAGVIARGPAKVNAGGCVADVVEGCQGDCTGL